MPRSWNLRDSWFIITLYLINGLSTDAKVFVRKFLDGYRKELLRNNSISYRIGEKGKNKKEEPYHMIWFL